MLEVVKYAFFSGVTCCGLAVLRGTKLNILTTCFISSFSCSSVFLIISKTNMFVIAAFLSTVVAASIVKYFSVMGKHGFLFIVIDRKSVVEGKSVRPGVDLGGRRSIKKKKH